MPSSGVDPALLTRMSMPPSAARAPAMAAATLPPLAASPGTAATLQLLPRPMSAAARLRRSPSRATSATSQPSRASSSAIARPIPRLAPVTRARLPCSLRSTSILLLDLGVPDERRPPVPLRLELNGEVRGGAYDRVPSLLGQRPDRVGFLQRRLGVRIHLGNLLRRHARRAEQGKPCPGLEARVAEIRYGRYLGQQRQP